MPENQAHIPVQPGLPNILHYTFKGEISIESIHKATLSVIPGALTSMLFLRVKKKLIVTHYDQFLLLNS